MSQTELLADVLKGNLDFLKMTICDFSDADMVVRPCPGANHAAWQLGHLISSETGSLGLLSGRAPELPAGFKEMFTKETAKIDDPQFFPKKNELVDAFARVRSATAEWVKSLKPADLERQSPEKIRGWAPTVGHWVTMTPVHVAMHVGQFQVIRRKLGKPVLY